MSQILIPRRRILRAAALSLPFFTVPGAFAERLAETPAMTEGPFYPDKLPLDTDNDLLYINDAVTPGVGTITHLTGRVLTAAGSPIRNAVVEIWQSDNDGIYKHSKSKELDKFDSNFQSFGRFLTDGQGRYYFRTIKPTPYSRRTPHIHFAVYVEGKHVLTSQILIKGYVGNAKDGLFNKIEKSRRDAVLADFVPVQGSTFGELQANFDIVLGRTPEAH